MAAVNQALEAEIAARKQVEEALVQAKTAAEVANVAKSQFLANMSHELRTPMNSILGMTELALGEQLSPLVRDCLNTTKESADALLELLNDLLDLSRIESGKLQLESTPFDLRAVVDRALRPLGVQADEKGLELVCDVGDGVPEIVVGDPLRLRQVLMNLLSNAMKFTHHGKIVVRVEPSAGKQRWGYRKGMSRENWPSSSRFPLRHPPPRRTILGSPAFSVQDTGIGIRSPEDSSGSSPLSPKADASTTRHYGGSGLGLAISQQFGRCDGRTDLAREPDGTRKHLLISPRLGVAPRPLPNMANEPPVGAKRPVIVIVARGAALPAPLRQLRVLMVEDNPAQPEVGGDRVEGVRGHVEIVLAGNGQEAVDWPAANRYDAILMDVQMPTMDGFKRRPPSGPTRQRPPTSADHCHDRLCLQG